ncbi:MAG TPA: NAD(P)-dependent alcohol dehydrogenase [Chloroflexi bacterium]|nr:NAD(P)-dependent alcohol dehydrogenase [Chloroflexota bacterium]
MKAIVFTEYGPPDVLHLKDIPKPTPKENEILVRVYATPINYGDLTARNFASSQFNMPALFYLPARLSFGWNKPKTNVLGSELAGQVEAIGQAVTKFRPGDQVFAYVGMKMRANAEYLCIPETGMVALKPANLTYAEAATLPYGAIMASSLLRKVDLQPGQKVLINGASGGIGSMAVQLAKHMGAEVTGVCGTARLDFVRSLGADRVIDYTQENFTQNGETYDLIFDILGKGSFARLRHSLTPNGIYLLASYKMKAVLQMLWTAVTRSRQKVICAFAEEKVKDLVFIKELAEAGQIKTIIDRCFPLEQAAEAHRYVESGNKMGPVVITIAGEGE